MRRKCLFYFFYPKLRLQATSLSAIISLQTQPIMSLTAVYSNKVHSRLISSKLTHERRFFWMQPALGVDCTQWVWNWAALGPRRTPVGKHRRQNSSCSGRQRHGAQLDPAASTPTHTHYTQHRYAGKSKTGILLLQKTSMLLRSKHICSNL